MDCIPYINDLQIEIDTLEKLNNSNQEIIDKINKKKKLLKECRDNLAKLSNKSIEYRLYLYLLDGMTPTQAVNKVADENYLNNIKPSSTNFIWKKYYKNLKKILKSK